MLKFDSFRETFVSRYLMNRSCARSCQTVMVILYSVAWHFIIKRLSTAQRLQIIQQLIIKNQRSMRKVFRMKSSQTARLVDGLKAYKIQLVLVLTFRIITVSILGLLKSLKKIRCSRQKLRSAMASYLL